MDLIQLLVLVAIIGLLVYGITTYIPMPPAFKNIIIVFAIVVVVWYLLVTFNLLPENVLPA
jgi:hypothetical protein